MRVSWWSRVRRMCGVGDCRRGAWALESPPRLGASLRRWTGSPRPPPINEGVLSRGSLAIDVRDRSVVLVRVMPAPRLGQAAGDHVTDGERGDVAHSVVGGEGVVAA